MKVLVGDSLGVVKLVNTQTKQVEAKYGESSQNNPIVKIINPYSHSKNIGVLFKQDFQFIDLIKQSRRFETKAISSFKSVSSKILEDFTRVLLAEESGKLTMLRNDLDKTSEISYDFSFEGNNKLEKILDHATNNNEVFALYQNTPLRVYDVEKKSIVFKSKNLPNDELDLQIPIWDTDLVEESPHVFYVSTADGKVDSII